MNLKIIFHFLIFTLITLVSSLAFAAPAGMHISQQLGKTKAISYMSPAGYSTCSLNELGWINCWGSNSGGQIGNNTVINSSKPIPIRSGMIQLDNARSAGGSVSGTTYGITLSGVLMSWGDNVFGKLGTGADDGVSFTPQVVDPNTRYKFIDAQYRHACALSTTNALKCWGYNNDGNLGDGTTIPKNTPVTIDAGVSYKNIAVGAFHSCGVTTGNVLKCWGLNSDNQLGDGTTIQRFLPVIIDSGTSYAMVSTGLAHSCGVTTTGVLKCWGSDGYGQLGDSGLAVSRSTPYIIDSGTTYAMVSVADNTSCAVTTSGALKCWGENTNGQIGDGSTTDRSAPLVINSGTSYLSVSAGGYHTCGITTAKVMKCWGLNDYGQLGTGAVGGFQPTPQTVVSP